MCLDDPVSIAILAKIRMPVGAKLTGAERASLEFTEAKPTADFDGTEDCLEAR